MDRLKACNPTSPVFRFPPDDLEALKAGLKEVIYEIEDGTDKPITKTRQAFEGMTIDDLRRVAKSYAICVEAKLIDKGCDEAAHDFF